MKICVKCSKQCEDPGWRCHVCGHAPPQKDGFVILAPNMLEVNDGYDVALFSEYAAIEAHHFWFVVRRKIIMDMLRSEFASSTSMLEIGCGNGFILSGVRKTFPGMTLWGSEASLQGLCHASKSAPEINFIQMDARLIPFEGEFDIIGAFDVLEHIDADEIVLRQMHRACKRDGGIILTVPQHQWLWSRTDEYAHHKRRYSRAELVGKVEAAGFSVERVTSFVFLLLPLMVISRLLQRKPKESNSPIDEGFRIGKFTNQVLSALLEIDRWFIRIGVSLPIGGSLLLVARKRTSMGNTKVFPSQGSDDAVPTEKKPNGKRQEDTWSLKQWIAWTVPPLLIVLFVGVVIAWLTDGQPSRTSYWSVQRDWFFALNLALSAWPRLFWSTLTLLGDGTVLLPVLSLLIIWRPQVLVAMLGSVPAAAALSITSKHLAAIPRPAAILDYRHFTVIGNTLAGHNSLPSGHCITVFAAAIAILAALIPAPQNRRQWILLLAGILAAAAACLSRVAVGAHWPLDLLVGAACGWIAGLSGAAVARRWPWRWNQNLSSRRILGAVLLVCSLLIMNRALVATNLELVLWPSTLCGMIASLWLLKARPSHLS